MNLEADSWHQSCACALPHPPHCPTVHHLFPSVPVKAKLWLRDKYIKLKAGHEHTLSISLLTLAHLLEKEKPKGTKDGDEPVLFLAVNIKIACLNPQLQQDCNTVGFTDPVWHIYVLQMAII